MKPNVIPKRAKKQKKRTSQKKAFDVKVIPAKNPVVEDEVDLLPKKRVAAYCRVSTDEEAQATSYDLQVDYYTKLITERDDWELVEVYADEGISGTQTKHRENFNRMIEDCEAGKIDMIITKSISRFARNVVDCISTVRKLKDRNPPISVYFEKERVDSLDEKMEVFLTMMASFAQEESRSISTNIRWAIQNRMKEGTQKVQTSGLYGYDTDEDGNMVIIEEEARVVRTIYQSFNKGSHPFDIAARLNGLGFTTVMGNPWTSYSVKGILRNEKYCGDVIMQKTFTVSYLTHKTKKNNGERDQYYIADHHDGIVTREEWDAAQERLEKIAGQRSKKKPKQQRLVPLRTGRLRGYIPIRPMWKTVSHTRLVNATEKLEERCKLGETGNNTDDGIQADEFCDQNNVEMAVSSVADDHTDSNEYSGVADDHVDSSEYNSVADDHTDHTNNTDNTIESEESTMAILEGFEAINMIGARGESVLTVSSSSIKFNKATAMELGYPAYARMLVNAKENKVALQAWPKKDDFSFEFSGPEGKQTYAISVKVPALLVEFRRYFSFEQNGQKQSYSLQGTLYPEEKVIIYDLGDAKVAKHRGPKKKKEATEANQAAQTGGAPVQEENAAE